MVELDEQVRSLLSLGDRGKATTLVLQELGPDILGFLSGALGDTLPEVGRIQAIMRAGRGWAVATSKGVILPQ